MEEALVHDRITPHPTVPYYPPRVDGSYYLTISVFASIVAMVCIVCGCFNRCGMQPKLKYGEYEQAEFLSNMETADGLPPDLFTDTREFPFDGELESLLERGRFWSDSSCSTGEESVSSYPYLLISS